MVTHKLTLDVARDGIQGNIVLVKGERASRDISFTLRNGKNTLELGAGYSAALRGIKPDGTELFNSCVVYTEKSVYPNTVRYHVTEQTVAAAGTFALRLLIWNNEGNMLWSPEFSATVKENGSLDSDAGSQSEFTALIDAAVQAQNAAKEAEDNAEKTTSIADYIEKAVKKLTALGIQLDDMEEKLIEKIAEALKSAKEYADENKAASNLLNGEGIDSIIQKYSGDVDDTHFGNSSTGESAAIFGEANKNSANRALMAGKLNENNGANGIVAGLYNIILKASNNIVGGRRNTLTEKGIECMVSGNNNVVDADCCIVAGSTNFITNNDGTVVVGGNNVVEDGGNSLIGGINNRALVHNGVVAGQQNNVDSSDSLTVGMGLKNLSPHFCGKAVIGKYNDEKHDTLFEVGNGNSDTDRSNAFEVIDRNGAVYLRVGATEISEMQLQLIGDMETALDELHNYAQALIGGTV